MNDLKFAFRQLLKYPGFSAVAVLTLALGIMATTAMYSVIYAVVLDPFPYKDVDNLMSVKVWEPGQRGYRTYYSTDQFLEIAERSSLFEGVIASTISDVVWTGGDLAARFRTIEGMVHRFEWFNPYDTDHLERIDLRLNQNALVGAAVDYIGSSPSAFARGESIVDAFAALIPRIVWPDKPIVAGSGTWVSRYTGLTFEENTSVGMGQVLEFYINFGPAGVVIGFLLLGTTVATIDSVARSRAVRGDWPGFALWYVPGTAFLQVGGSLVEITSSAAAAAVAAILINRYVVLRLRPQAPGTDAPDSLAATAASSSPWS